MHHGEAATWLNEHFIHLSPMSKKAVDHFFLEDQPLFYHGTLLLSRMNHARFLFL